MQKTKFLPCYLFWRASLRVWLASKWQGLECYDLALMTNETILCILIVFLWSAQLHNILVLELRLFYQVLRVWATLVPRLVPSNQDQQESRLGFQLGSRFDMWWAWDRHPTRWSIRTGSASDDEKQRGGSSRWWEDGVTGDSCGCVCGAFSSVKYDVFVMDDRLATCSCTWCVSAAI